MAQNNFDSVRVGLAWVVVLCHVAVLSAAPPLQGFLRVLSADFAVKGFFVVSGCLVMRSYLRSASWRDYAGRRLRRIYPAYLLALLVALLIGAATTELPQAAFWRHPATARYLAANAVFLNFLQSTLPGVFLHNPLPAVNGALWTIKVELCLYACVPGLAGLFRRWGGGPTWLGLMAVAVVWELLPGWLGLPPRLGAELARQFPGCLPFFGAGAWFAVEETRLRPWLGWVAVGGVAAYAGLGAQPVWLVLQPLCYAAVVLALATQLPWRLPLGQAGDISYGTYLLHFPLIQLLVAQGWFGAWPWATLLALAVLLTAAALASWHLLEKRLLRRTAPTAAQALRPG